MTVTLHPLGRRTPPEFPHVEKYPLSALPPAELPKGVPVVLGVNWYANFDTPVKDGSRWWIGKNSQLLGRVRGGHCVCLKPGTRTDPTSWWTFYDQGREGACFKAGTLIRMADGTHKQIEDVRLLDLVATAEGRVGRVAKTFVRFHDEGMIRVKLVGHRHLRLTGEHPVLTARGYVPAEELRLGDEVALTRYQPEAVEEIEVASLVEERLLRQRTSTRRLGGVATVVQSPPRTVKLTAGFGRLVGLFLAEGSTTAQKVVWTFGGHERDTLAEETVSLVREALDADAKVQVRPNGVVNVVLYGKAWRLLFEGLFKGEGPHEKRCGVANGPTAYLEAVLEGWLAGDGYERRSTRQGVTVSHVLALDMYALAQALGRRPTLRWSPPTEQRRGRWDVEMATGGHSTRSRQDKAAVWRKVVGVEYEDYAGFVFNFEVEGDNSYVAEGVGVHNCVGFGCTRAMSLLNRRRYLARWLWDHAKLIDPWEDTKPGDDNGTSVSAGFDVLRTVGHVLFRKGQHDLPYQTRDELAPTYEEGISANRWTTNVADVLDALASPLATKLGAVPILNSWGRGFPHITWMPAETLQRLADEEGEIGIPTDR